MGQFLKVAAARGARRSELTEPLHVFGIMNEVREGLDPWGADLEALLRESQVIGAGERMLLPFLLADPGTRWLREPVDLSAQMIVADESDGQQPRLDPVARRARETYIQCPLGCVLTSTLHGSTTSMHSVIRDHIGDMEPSPGDTLVRLVPPSNARVFEIRSALDWATLCRIGRDAGSGPVANPQLDSSGFLSPSWDLVRRHYDAVHISLLGFLRTWLVTTIASGTSTRLWAWDGESTVWLAPADAYEDTGLPNPSRWDE